MEISKDSLGDRMKAFESQYKTYVTPNEPVILRVDGKAFHTYTKSSKKPFDDTLIELMNETALSLCRDIQGAILGYVQSDEISILLYPWINEKSEAWFDGQVQKMASVSAGMASATFTRLAVKFNQELDNEALCGWAIKSSRFPDVPVVFDSRVFTLPSLNEVQNYFIWRQKDWIRNSIQMMARSLYSQEELNGKKVPEMLKMIEAKDKSWHLLNSQYRLGRTLVEFQRTCESPNIPGLMVARNKWEVTAEDFVAEPRFVSDRVFAKKALAVVTNQM